MAAPGVDARASGRLGRLLTLFILAWFLPTGSGFAITSIGSFAQCFPTVITWDVGQSLPPFTLSISSISTASNPTDASLHFTGFEGVSATVTLNLPAKTRIDLVLENSGGVLAQALNLVIQPGTDSGCANSALSGSHPPEVASIVSSLPGLSTETSDTRTGLQPGVIGAIVACAILSLAFVLALLFWCKRRRQDQREMRGMRLHSPGPSVSSFRRASVGAASVRQELAPPSIFWREPQASPRSVGATIGEPSGEAIMEHRNKPLPTPDTPSVASSPAGGTSSSQPMGPRSTFVTSNPSIVTIMGRWRGFERHTWDSSRSASNFSNVFDDTSSEVPSTAPPPYAWYE